MEVADTLVCFWGGSIGHVFQAETGDGAQPEGNAGEADKGRGAADARGHDAAWETGKTAYVKCKAAVTENTKSALLLGGFLTVA